MAEHELTIELQCDAFRPRSQSQMNSKDLLTSYNRQCYQWIRPKSNIDQNPNPKAVSNRLGLCQTKILESSPRDRLQIVQLIESIDA
jgi:energy-converting hydrogenase Eha subunit F